jgi:glycosyltransferase involved in cell wall biosynthesis
VSSLAIFDAATNRQDLWQAYKLRWRRRRLLWRALGRARQLRQVVRRTALISRDDILCFATMRNEILRLPYWLDHHRKLGVRHFLIVDNDSDDGTADLLAAQSDVSLWTTAHSYKRARFGMDWLTVLQWRYGHGHWCLTLDADEIFIPPYHDSRTLAALTRWLDTSGVSSLGALMLDLYPKGPVGAAPYTAGDDPARAIPYFDSGNYVITRQEKLQNLWIQGGVRARCFFATDPQRAPTLSKVPLVKWDRNYVYVSSTHSVLPRRLNHVYATDGGEKTSGILLHTKFLNTIVAKSGEERRRREHFENSDLYDTYYQSLENDPDLWTPRSARYIGWRHLEALGLMSRGRWL